jgi:hypothetical protein
MCVLEWGALLLADWLGAHAPMLVLLLLLL